jgi:hypothetical protein
MLELRQTIQPESIVIQVKYSVNLLAELFNVGSSADVARTFGSYVSSVALRPLKLPTIIDTELSGLAVPAKIVFEHATCAPSP